MKVIPENYKLLFENAFVRVIEARVPPGTEEKPHRHMRGVSICMTEYTVESRILPDGQWVRSDRKHGTVYWSESSLHILRNVGKTTSHTIRVELKYSQMANPVLHDRLCPYMASGEAKYASRRLGWVVPSSVKWGRAKLSIYIATRVPLFLAQFSVVFHYN